MMTKMSVLPQERCLRRLIAFGEEDFEHSHNWQSGQRMSLLSNPSFSFLGKGFRKVFSLKRERVVKKMPMSLRLVFFLGLFWQMFLLSPIAKCLAELLTADPRNILKSTH